MRIPAKIPVLLALAVIVFTPADIREVAERTMGEARMAIAKLLGVSQPVAVAQVSTKNKSAPDMSTPAAAGN